MRALGYWLAVLVGAAAVLVVLAASDEADGAAATAVKPEPFKPIDRFANRRPISQQSLALLPFGGTPELQYHTPKLKMGVGVGTGTDNGRPRAIESLDRSFNTGSGGSQTRVRPGVAPAALGTRTELRDFVEPSSGGVPKITQKRWRVPDGNEGTVVAGMGVGGCTDAQLCVAYLKTRYSEKHTFTDAQTEGSTVVTSAHKPDADSAVSVGVGTFDAEHGPSVVVAWVSGGTAYATHFKATRSSNGGAKGVGEFKSFERDGDVVPLGQTHSPGVTLAAGDFVAGGADELAVVGLRRTMSEVPSDYVRYEITVGVLRPSSDPVRLVEYAPITAADQDFQLFKPDTPPTLVGAVAVREEPRPMRRGDSGRDRLVLAPPSHQGPAVMQIDPAKPDGAVKISHRGYNRNPHGGVDYNAEKSIVNIGDVDDDGVDDVITGDAHGRLLTDTEAGLVSKINYAREFETILWLAEPIKEGADERVRYMREHGAYTKDLGLSPHHVSSHFGSKEAWLRYVTYVSADARTLASAGGVPSGQAMVPVPGDPARSARQIYMVGYYSNPTSEEETPYLKIAGLRLERSVPANGSPKWHLQPFTDSRGAVADGPQVPAQRVVRRSRATSETPEGGVTPLLAAPIALDGVVEVGEPKQTAVRRIEPLVILNAPPTHFDVLGDRAYDMNFCYAGNQYLVPPVCFFKSGYERQTTASKEVTSQTTEAWSVGASVTLGNETSVNILDDTLSVERAVELQVKGSYGERYTSIDSFKQSDTVAVTVSAVNTDKIYALYRHYDVLQYPVYQPGMAQAVSWLEAITPQTLRKRWLDSNSAEAVGYRQVHEPGNILSYPGAVPEGAESGALPFLASKPFAVEEFELSDSSDYTYELTDDRMALESADLERTRSIGGSLTNSAELSVKAPVAPGVEVGGSLRAEVKLEAEYNENTLQTHTTTVGDTTTLRSQLGGIDESLGDVSYTVKPFAYYNSDDALVLDYAVEPSLAPPGDPVTFWQRHYGRRPDVSMLLPRRLDVEKQAGISADAARFGSPDVDVLQPRAGDSCAAGNLRDVGAPYPQAGGTVCLQATVRNYSLRPSSATDLQFYLGDPDVGGRPLTKITVPEMPDRGRETLPAVALTLTDQHAASNLRVFAVLDGEDDVPEVHEDNNKGFTALNVHARSNRTAPALTAPVDVDAELADGDARAVDVSWSPPAADLPAGTEAQVVGYRQDSKQTRSAIAAFDRGSMRLSGLPGGRWRFAVFSVRRSDAPTSSEDADAGIERRSPPSHPSEPVDVPGGADPATPVAQTIEFNELPDAPYGTAPITLSATASSGLAVTYETNGLCSVSGAVLTLSGVGTCSITANQAGDARFLPATPVTRSLNVTKANTRVSARPFVLSVAPGNRAVATLVSAVTDKPIVGATMTLRTGETQGPRAVTICTAETDDTGTVTCPMSAAAQVAAIETGSFTADYAGNAKYEASSDTAPVCWGLELLGLNCRRGG